LAKESFTLNLKPGETFSHDTAQIGLQFDDSAYAKFGKKYEGYLLYVTDKDNHLLKVESSNTGYVKNLGNASALAVGDDCNKELKRVGARNE
jgi:hypothetical protein